MCILFDPVSLFIGVYPKEIDSVCKATCTNISLHYYL